MPPTFQTYNQTLQCLPSPSTAHISSQCAKRHPLNPRHPDQSCCLPLGIPLPWLQSQWLAMHWFLFSILTTSTHSWSHYLFLSLSHPSSPSIPPIHHPTVRLSFLKLYFAVTYLFKKPYSTVYRTEYRPSTLGFQPTFPLLFTVLYRFLPLSSPAHYFLNISVLCSRATM